MLIDQIGTLELHDDGDKLLRVCCPVCGNEEKGTDRAMMVYWQVIKQLEGKHKGCEN